ncbi:sugar/nucleoside kinase (ribokinase family) [Actinocorallia herbida]|uniref:Sugar/nucleoside kinase (Ribokinase family) n=1 Tax=Actinocorallia herbida TaxID=58109 RepID=A0A3N1D0C5_9ACTN|nr:carbohydrate kinase family protein [Actinocorallia herbida]ROO86981.1 sugar/nucleoside kinase (ribokinase family) [Actinocorallia herbida]
MRDLVVVGDTNPDVLLFGAPETPPFGQAETLVSDGVLALGGSAAIVAHGAARLGLDTALVSMVGRDAAGDFVLDVLRAAGVDVSGVVRHPELPTALTVCLNRPDGDRAILTAPGCLPHFTAAELPEARHAHAASYFLQPVLDVVGLFRRFPGSTSLDTNHDPSGRWELAEGLPDVVDVLLPNEAEAASLPRFPGTTVVKRGARGALALPSGTSVPSPPVTPVDTVGAGDSFDAGFLAGWLDTGDLEYAMRLGCACGALSTRAPGGTAAQPTRAEVDSLIRA